MITNILDNLQNKNVFKFRNLRRDIYCTLLAHASFIIGNSSSGIIEAPLVKTTCINIGRRQIGRLQSTNVINIEGKCVETIKKAILKALSREQIIKTSNCVSPYGDGQTTDRIINLIIELQPSIDLVTKELTC